MADNFNSTAGPTVSANGSEEHRCQLNKAFQHILLPTFYSIAFVLGLIGNGLALWMFSSARMRPWTSITVYMFNLALADLLYIFTLPFLIFYYLNRTDWIFGEAWCKAERFIFHVNLYGSILFLTCISAHRYAGVVHTMRSLGRLKRRHARLMSAVVWAVVVAEVFPSLIFAKTGKNHSGGKTCYDTAPDDELERYLTYNLAVTVLGFLVPFVVILVCYGFIACKLVQHQLSNATLRQRSLRLVVIVMISFSVCFLPYHVMRNVNILARLYLGPSECELSARIYAVYQVTRGLASVNSCIDPVLYFLAGDTFRRRVSTTKRRRQQQQQQHHALTAKRLPVLERAAQEEEDSVPRSFDTVTEHAEDKSKVLYIKAEQ
ncbi:P2Y purinoceptor 1-like [Lampetra fluviatilis]